MFFGAWIFGCARKQPAEPDLVTDDIPAMDDIPTGDDIPARDEIPSRCGRPPSDDMLPGDDMLSIDSYSHVPNELVGLFETEQQAQEAAELYGIELTSYLYGVAVFTYEGNLQELIEQGQKNGWPLLSLNRIHSAF